jgi:hypothetical protein
MKNGAKYIKSRADRFYSNGGVHRAMKPLSVTATGAWKGKLRRKNIKN